MFTCKIPIRITDINYGNHVGNDSVLSLLHEARIQWLNSIGLTELKFGGVGIIMRNVNIEFKKEVFYGDVLIASVHAIIVSKIAFDVFYKLEKELDGKTEIVVTRKSGMICYDYSKKKISAIPFEAIEKLQIM